MSKKSNNSSTLGVPDDLHLSAINFPKFSKNTVSDELNTYLRDQLEHMKNENEILERKLSEKDLNLKKSQTKISELSGKIGVNSEFTSATQLANSKIVELSKKLRDKTSETEMLKHKCAKLENSLSELQQKQSEVGETAGEKEQSEKESDVGELKKLQDKLAFTSNKWAEEKNLNLQLKNDLKKANKWLQQEVGEKFETLLTLNNSPSNWRGRAQIICDLQQKNSELKEKLRAYQENKGVANTETAACKADNKKLEALSKENSEIKHSYEEMKRKFEVIKARSKVLETECALLKSKISTLNQNHEADQQTITDLMVQISGFNREQNDNFRQQQHVIKKLEKENEALRIELEKEKCLSENKSKEIVNKDNDIQILNKRIRSARPTSSYIHKTENPEAKTMSRLEVERLRLLELTEVQNKRLQEERNSHLKTQHLLRIEKQKGARLEASLARLQLEQNSARSGYSSKSTISKQNDFEIEDKLELAEENIKALTTRLELEIFERKKDIQEFSKILRNQEF